MESRYLNGDYGNRNPSWHVEDSAWKARQIARLIGRNPTAYRTICDVGCGAGETIRQLQLAMGKGVEFWGYEVAPEAFERCRSKENPQLHFRLADVSKENGIFFDLLLLIDVIEHVPDYLGFLQSVRNKGAHKILHIPLEISVQSIMRVHPLHRARTEVGHLHYFTKELALDSLRDCGYEILDFFYTAGTVELPGKSIISRLASVPRALMFALHQDLAVRLLGGFSLLVLAK